MPVPSPDEKGGGRRPYVVKPTTAMETITRNYIPTGERNEAGHTNGTMTVKDLIADLLIPKHYIRVVCWNIRTLYQTGKLAQAVNEMKQDNLSLLAMSEVR